MINGHFGMLLMGNWYAYEHVRILQSWRFPKGVIFKSFYLMSDLLFWQDIDCMPLYRFENMPMLGGHTVAADKFLENFKELQINGRLKEYMKLSSSDILESNDGLGLSQLSPFPNLSSSLKPTKA